MKIRLIHSCGLSFAATILLLSTSQLAWGQPGRPPGPGGPRPGDDAAACGSCLSCGGCILVPIIALVVVLGVLLPAYIGVWKAFAKGGEPGIAGLIPIWHNIALCKIAGKEDNRWPFHLIPAVGFVFYIQDLIDFCRAFGKEGGFAVGILLLPMIFWPILGFGSARYQGVVADSGRRRRRAARYEEEDDRPRRKRRYEDDE